MQNAQTLGGWLADAHVYGPPPICPALRATQSNSSSANKDKLMNEDWGARYITTVWFVQQIKVQ